MVRCPKDCDKRTILVYGIKKFAVSSKICQAGIFIGAIDARVGGVFLIQIGSAIEVLVLIKVLSKRI
jgi:hypothetical protein